MCHVSIILKASSPAVKTCPVISGYLDILILEVAAFLERMLKNIIPVLSILVIEACYQGYSFRLF